MKKIVSAALLLLLTYTQTVLSNTCTPVGNNTTIPDIKLETIASNLEYPVHITNDGFHDNRIYITEQDGRIQIFDINKKIIFKKPFLDIQDRVVSGGEKGLLSIAFHPDFPRDKRFFINYTARQNGLYTIISEYKAHEDLMTADTNEQVLIKIPQPYGNHNGGQIAFDPDGYLYIGMGDGGSGNDPLGNGQNINTLLGAMLRIDINRKTRKIPYAIPVDNPFINKKMARPEIWAYGLRNPWRFSFDAVTGKLWTADVGQYDAEEIDIIKRGGNYGWNIMEGNICTPKVNKNCDPTDLEAPIFTYGRDQGKSITGGMVYRGKTINGLCGVYIFGDYVMQRIWGIRFANKKVTAQKELTGRGNLARGLLSYINGESLFISSFGEDMSNEIYVAAHRSGKIFKIVPAQ